MISNRDIVIVGLQPWDIEIGSNCKNIAIEFARNNRVLYVNSPLDTITIWKSRDKTSVQKRLEFASSGNNLVQVASNIWNLYPKSIIRSANWIPFTSLFRAINKLNNRRFAQDISAAISVLSFKNVLLFNDSDMFRSFYLQELIHPAVSIYYSRDNLMSQRYFYKHGHILEPELIKKSTVVVANSEYLAGLARKFNEHSYYVGQGCDLSLFNPTIIRRRPADMENITGPVIGYIGALSAQRLDISLLTELCSKKKEWNFVFIGEKDKEFENSVLNILSNVFFLGLKEGKQLPDYLSYFDIAMNPQLINEMTIGNYPRKIDEYLAMGKPVVATETVAMNIFKKVTYLGKSADEYISLINTALTEDSVERQKERIRFARTHTWENSVNAIYAAVENAQKINKIQL